MLRRPLRLTFYALLGCCFAISSHTSAWEARPVYSGLIAHEWGTFTSIAGRNGAAVQWLPLNGSTDLPGFVEHFRHAGFKLGLRGTVRMETPVLYFYGSREGTVSVKVSFAKGMITEWYPQMPVSGSACRELEFEHVAGLPASVHTVTPGGVSR